MTASSKPTQDTPPAPTEKGGIPLALLGWLIGVPGLIVLLLLIF